MSTLEPLSELYGHYLNTTGVTIDTRTILGGEMFFALKGERSNGNEFAKQALEKGASYAIIEDPQYQINDRCILVGDSLTAMQQLAKFHRSKFNFPVLAITGSNGKTTTKELVHAVLSKKYITYATKGNLNNHIGVPLTLLSIKNDCQFAVIEMGANHQKEIEFYCSIANPDFGLITNIGKAHLEGFGGFEGVKKAKGELYRFIIEKREVIFAHSGLKVLKEIYGNYDRVVKYGFDEKDYLYGKIISDNEFASVSVDDEIKIVSKLVGNYNADNILAAACIGKYFDIGYAEIKSAIEDYTPSNNRSELKKIGENYFILDAYNANPSSVKAALENFSNLKAEKKIAILGDMLELGEYAREEHKNILDLALNSGIDKIITVGPEFKSHLNPAIVQFENSEEARTWFAEQHFSGATILLKGSRGIKLERIVG